MPAIIPSRFDLETPMPESRYCECGKQLDACSGDNRPSPGDATLCIDCGSLNFFGDDLRLRKPTDEEMLEAAADPGIQRLRRAIITGRKTWEASKK